MLTERDRELTRRQMLARTAAASAGLLGAGLMGAEGASERRRPNVILIYTDDQNFEHIGCYGHRVYTPYQDRLAAEGIRFTRAYTTISVCTPSRYSCLTGQYPSRCTHPDFLASFPDGTQLEPSFNTELHRDMPNLARVMRGAGYATGMVGKWHLGDGAEGDAKNQGIRLLPQTDAWTEQEGEADPLDPKVSELLRHNYGLRQKALRSLGFDYAESVYFGNPEGFASHPMNVHNMEWIAQGALDFIDRNKDQPFFLYMAPTLHHIPHPQESLMQADPRVTPAGYLDKAPEPMPSRQDILADVRAKGFPTETAYCAWLDEGIGAVMNRLKALGLEQDTLVILCSDHQTHAKGTLYEGGVRAPCIMRYPRRVAGGRVSSSLAQNIDFVPTILEACGIERPAVLEVDGQSLMPLLEGRRDKIHDELFFEIGWTRAVCTERWKYLALRYSRQAETLALHSGKRLYHNYVLEPHQHHVLLEHPNFWDLDELYDLETDAIEVTNRAQEKAHAAQLADMQARLKRWLKTFGDHPFGEFVHTAT